METQTSSPQEEQNPQLRRPEVAETSEVAEKPIEAELAEVWGGLSWVVRARRDFTPLLTERELSDIAAKNRNPDAKLGYCRAIVEVAEAIAEKEAVEARSDDANSIQQLIDVFGQAFTVLKRLEREVPDVFQQVVGSRAVGHSEGVKEQSGEGMNGVYMKLQKAMQRLMQTKRELPTSLIARMPAANSNVEIGRPGNGGSAVDRAA